LGVEEYELLVSTLNKLPILKENLTSKREEYGLARRMVYSQKAEIDEVKKKLETKDEEIGKIDSKIKENNQTLEELDQEIADLYDKIQIEEKIVEPYSQTVHDASERVIEARKSWWNLDDNRVLVYSILGACFFYWAGVSGTITSLEGDNLGVGVCCSSVVLWVILLFILTADEGENNDSGRTKLLIRKKDDAEHEWDISRTVLAELESRTNYIKATRRSCHSSIARMEKEKGRLIELEKKLEDESKVLDDFEETVSTYFMSIESLEKEIEEGQNAIAPLIPYSNLLLDSSEE
jgi:chromosome segregation ATPase